MRLNECRREQYILGFISQVRQAGFQDSRFVRNVLVLQIFKSLSIKCQMSDNYMHAVTLYRITTLVYYRPASN